MPSRRQVLTGLGTATVIGVAGCTGSDSASSGTIDCRSHALEHGDGDVLDAGVMATVEDEDVRLTIPLAVETVYAQNVERLEISDATGDLAHVIPVSPEDADLMANKPGVGEGQLRYEQYLGRRPFHGEYTVTAIDNTGAEVDSMTIEFNCFPEIDD